MVGATGNLATSAGYEVVLFGASDLKLIAWAPYVFGLRV